MTIPICLAGMHRSGTSLVTHTLRECGLYLGEERDLVPASPANPDGYWEHRKFVEINEELLRILGGDWATPVAIPEPSSALWREHADLARLRKSAEELGASFAGHGVWGWKDPRNSITLPFWLGLLGQLRIIVSVRHPLEVAASLKRVDPNASIAAGVERWLTYYQRLLADAPKEARLLTHTGSYLCEPAAEIRRVAEFAGLAPGAKALNRSISVIRPDLRRNRFTADEVADFDLSPDAIDVYGRMCEEAGWDEGRARVYSGVRAPSGAVAVEEFQRLFAARATHTRRLAEHAQLLAEAGIRFARQQEELERQHLQMERRDDDLLRAMQTGITVRGLARDYRRLVEYRRMVRQVQRVVRNVIPAGSAVLVISRGDEELMTGSNATCFPQGSDRLYSGYHPTSSLNAIGHLEALRARGAEFLVVPTTELWWLDQYREFGRHVRARYQTVLEDQWSCTIFALRDPGAKPRSAAEEFDEMMSVCEDMLQREPAILDWGTGWRLASECPGRTVFGPPMDDQVLPYLDRSVDVVAVPAGSPERIVEAGRVASTAVVVFPEAANSAQPLGVRWINETAGHFPTVSIIVTEADAERESSPALRSLRETVPQRFNAELLVGHDVAVSLAQASGEILVFVDPGAVVLPGWLPPLLRLFRDRPRAGAAGGKVLASDGRLEYGGGVVAAGGAVQSIGEDDYAAGGPASDVVRQVDWCSPVILATRRSLFTELGGFDGRYSSPLHAAADYCLRLRERGHDILFQPDTAVVRVEAAPAAGDPPAEFIARWSSPESR